MKKAPLLFALSLLLAGCGYHLRGGGGSQVELQDQRIFLVQSKAGNLARELRPLLGDAGANLANTRSDAEYVLSLENEKMDRDVLSVSPQTGKAEEYQLTYTVVMNVSRIGKEKPLVRDQKIMLQRDFTFDQDAVLGKFSEEELLRDELLREAAEQVLRRLSAALQHGS